MSIKLRTVKGSTLTFGEVDENFSSLFYSASLEGRELSLYYTSSQLSPTTNPVTFTVPGFPYTGSAQITGSLGITGSLQVTGSATFLAGLTGSLLGNASTATTASHVNLIPGEYIKINKVNDMFIISGSTFPYTGSAIITGSLEVSDGITGSLQGNATTATKLQTARNINGVPFDGSANITITDSSKLPLAGGTMTGNISFVAGQPWPTFNQDTTGNAATATRLQTARNINGVSFDGSANITITDSTKLPIAGGTMTGPISFAGNQTWPTFNQNTTGNAATAAILQVPRNINGVAFDGSADITIPIADSTKLPLAGGTMTGAITFAAGQTWPTFNQNTTGTAGGVAWTNVSGRPTAVSSFTNDSGYLTSLTGAVLTTGDQTIAGVKTFTSSQVVISSSTTPGLFFSSARTSGVSGNITDDGNMTFTKNEIGGGFKWRIANGSYILTIDSGGSATFTGSVTATGFFNSSDSRLKSIIKRDGDVAYYRWLDGRDNKEHIGYIAQEQKDKYPDQIGTGADNYLTVNYVEILVAKVRELEKEIELLKSKV
jgi:hypothetical protein